MIYRIAITDTNWFNFLSEINPQDVNFWQPGGLIRFQQLQSGSPFLFKLKYPVNAIAGMGFFSNQLSLPLSIAWDIFREQNGCLTLQEFTRLIKSIKPRFEPNPEIGCIVLTNPIFFDKRDWIPAPEDWGKSIQTGKYYNTEETIGKRVWNKIELLLNKYLIHEPSSRTNQFMVEEAPSERYRNTVLSKVRIGQDAFRTQVLEAYQKRCAITGERILPVLEAAHIQRYSEMGPHMIANGLLLRSDLHKLFDTGYITITTNYNVEISKRLKEDYHNGKEYYKLHGEKLFLLPEKPINHPNKSFIEWHNQRVYNG